MAPTKWRAAHLHIASPGQEAKTVKICIDPGHGGTDPGAIGTAPAAASEPALTLKECDFTLDVALLLEEELARRGHSVFLTRRRDRSLQA